MTSGNVGNFSNPELANIPPGIVPDSMSVATPEAPNVQTNPKIPREHVDTTSKAIQDNAETIVVRSGQPVLESDFVAVPTKKLAAPASTNTAKSSNSASNSQTNEASQAPNQNQAPEISSSTPKNRPNSNDEEDTGQLKQQTSNNTPDQFKTTSQGIEVDFSSNVDLVTQLKQVAGENITTAPKSADFVPLSQAKVEPTKAAFTNGTYNATQSMVDQAFDVLVEAKNVIDQLPEGAEKQSFQDYLKLIGAALLTAQKLLYEMQSQDSTKARLWNTAVMEMAQNKITQQQEAQKEMQKKMAKANKKSKEMNKINKIFGPMAPVMSGIMTAVTIAVFILLLVNPLTMWTAPLMLPAVALTVAMFVDSCMTSAGQSSMVTSGFNTMTSVLTNIGKMLGLKGSELENFALAMKIIAVTFIALGFTASMVSNPTGILLYLCGGAAPIMQFVTQSEIITDFVVKGAGGSQQDAMIAQAVIMGTIQIGMVIASLGAAIVMAVLTMGAGTVAATAQTIINSLQQGFKAFVQALWEALKAVMQGIVQYMKSLLDTVKSALQAVKSVATTAKDVVVEATRLQFTLMKDLMLSAVRSVATTVRQLLAGPKDWVEAVYKGLNAFSTGVQATLILAQASQKVANSVYTMNIAKINAEIALIRGRSEANAAEQEAQIKLIRRLVKEILDGLNQLMTGISNISETFKNMYQGQSDALSGMYRAARA